MGAWRYFHVEASERTRLPWYCQPWFWGAAALVLGLIIIKDLLGTALPHWLVQPLHFLELIENKISAGLAGGTLVPLIALRQLLDAAYVYRTLSDIVKDQDLSRYIL